ncbi:MAG TPA: NUDIX domain-containing protein [Gemmatimonadaceae bacterium]|nr:NUDIX domain-containing protein [Gemmatimonadaceae bacterium]
MPTPRRRESAGLLLYKRTPAGLLVLLAHPGGPFWRGRDDGAWTIPKGEAAPGEDLLDAARREFAEETGLTPVPPFVALGSVRQKSGKVVHAWAVEGDADPACLTSNVIAVEWPRGSGRHVDVPEVDRAEWFAPDVARRKLNPAQAAFVDRLEGALKAASG